MICRDAPIDLELTERALQLELEAAQSRFQSVKVLAQRVAVASGGAGICEAEATAALRMATSSRDCVLKQYAIAMKRLSDFMVVKGVHKCEWE
jgi:hypothetical protein